MYVIGVFRRTALWGIFLVVLGSIALGNSNLVASIALFAGAYIFFVLVHLLACKIQKSDRSSGEIYFSALGHDLAAPFSKLGLFIAVLFKKWVIQDDSKFHNFVDGTLVVLGGIWAIIIWGLAAFFILSLVL